MEKITYDYNANKNEFGPLAHLPPKADRVRALHVRFDVIVKNKWALSSSGRAHPWHG